MTGTGQSMVRAAQQPMGGGEALHRLLLSKLENKMAALKSDQVRGKNYLCKIK
jgi:hypothetical protein